MQGSEQAKLNQAYRVVQEGLGFYDQGKYQEAIARYRSSIDIHPNFAAFAGWGLALYDQGKYDIAITKYEKSLSLQPHPTTYFNLGLVYFHQENYENAVELFQKAVSEDEGNILYNFNLGLALSKLNRPDESMQIMLKARELAKKNAIKKDEALQVYEGYQKITADLLRDLELQIKHQKSKEERVNNILELINANSEEDLQNIVYQNRKSSKSTDEVKKM